MFKKLKDKIAEEAVKISPQRIQQFTQSVTDKLQNSGNEENLFSLTDDDGSQASGYNAEPGFTNVSLHASAPNEGRMRRNSSSSIASDVSFLPRYESVMSAYHLQSDLDISASEMEDNVSTSSQLGHVSKEQVYSAFQKAQMRYHKYRGRYTDLANHYKELERENSKMKAVLVETQDKAIRRVSELREQCSLSQKAKADLEQALRTEIEEKLIVISTLKDKVDLLQNNAAETNETTSNSRPMEIDSRQIDALNEKIQELKATTIVLQSKDSEHREKIASLEQLLADSKTENRALEERERGNNLKFAKSKMELHAELQNRELETGNLKRDLETVRHELESYESRNGSSLKAQNSKLIEKFESLSQKCKNYEGELIKMEQYRLEVAALQAERSETRKKYEEVDRNLQELKNGAGLVDDLRQELQKGSDEMAQLKSDLSEADINFKEIEKANDVLRTSLEEAAKENENLSTNLEKIKKQLEESDVHHKEQSITLQEKTKKSLLSLEDRIKTKLEATYKTKEDELRHDFERKLSEFEANDDDVKQTRIKLLHSEENLTEMNQLLEKLKHELQKRIEAYKILESNHLDLIEENNSRQLECTEAKKKSLSQESEICNAHKELEDLRKKVDEIIVEFKQNDKTEEVLQLESKLSKLQSANENLQREFSKVQEESAILRAANDEMLEESVRLNEELKKSLEENATLNLQLNQLKTEFKDGQAELDGLRKYVEVIKENLAGKEQELARSVEDHLEKLAMKDELYEDSKRALNEEIQKIIETKQKLLDENKQLENEILKISEESVSLKNASKMKENETENSEKALRDKLSEYVDENNVLVENKKIDAENIVRLEQDLFEKDAILNELNTEIKNLKEKDEGTMQLVQRSEQLEKQLNRYETVEKINLQEQIGALNERVASLSEIEEKYKGILDENQNLKVEISQLDELQAKINVLSEEMQQKVSKIAELNREVYTLNSYKDDNDKLLDEISETRNTIKEISAQKQLVTEQYERLKVIESQYADVVSTDKDNNGKIKTLQDNIGEINARNVHISEDNRRLTEENDRLIGDIEELKMKYENFDVTRRQLEEKLTNRREESVKLSEELEQIKIERENLKSLNERLEQSQRVPNRDDDLHTKLTQLNTKFEQVYEENLSIKSELIDGKALLDSLGNDKRRLETQLNDLEHHCSELSHEKQLLKDEVDELKISPINFNDSKNHEVESLREKLSQYKSIDLTNRNSIEFYENELQKMKNKNEKLNRKLDETLVTLNHCADLSQSTEIEYLKNVLYNYMLGKESMVMARVLAAVCKFDTQMTDTVLKHEQDKQSLLGQLGIL